MDKTICPVGRPARKGKNAAEAADSRQRYKMLRSEILWAIFEDETVEPRIRNQICEIANHLDGHRLRADIFVVRDRKSSPPPAEPTKEDAELKAALAAYNAAREHVKTILERSRSTKGRGPDHV